MIVLLFVVGVAGIAIVGDIGKKVGTGLEASDGFSAQPVKTRLHSKPQKMM